MTENEIIKAFTICANQGACKDCPLNDLGGVERCMHTLLLNALDLINRQQTEIERNLKRISNLKHASFELQSYTAELQKEIATAKFEAYKEYAESCKACFPSLSKVFDIILKEMGCRE